MKMARQLSVVFLFVAASISGIILAETSRKELRTKEVHQERIIQQPGQIRPPKSNTIDPSRVIQLSWQPRVFLYRGFLKEEECDQLISGDDEIAARVDERISAWSFLPKENGNPLQVQHLELEDTKEKKTRDFFGNISTWQLTGPVLATVVFYLSNVTQGGQILFPKAEVRKKILSTISITEARNLIHLLLGDQIVKWAHQNKDWSDCMNSNDYVRPTKGNAIIFFNLHLDATPDGKSSHARCPILEGDMWCATKTFHLNPPPNSDCTDEDESCPRWAALGECNRNPVFMVGSPDYYGTCRKSCNACVANADD